MLIKYQLKRSKKRKTLAIKIKANQVWVYAPNYLALKVIEEWLFTKQSWIEKHLANQQSQAKAEPILQQQWVTFAGHSYELSFGQDAVRSQVILSNEKIQINTSKRIKHIKEKQLNLLMNFAAEQLTQYCEAQATDMAKILAVKFNDLKVKHIRSRWGSCDSKGRLQFNLQLVTAPLWVIDYVIAHEVAHLKVMDHSKRFWQVVNVLYPEYVKAEKWLKQNGYKLDVFKI